MRAEDETDLLTRLRSRDPAAFGEIVAAWSPRMLSLARVGGAPTAQLVQQAWLIVIERLDSYPGRPGLSDLGVRHSGRGRAGRPRAPGAG
jgi:hypothetical protein